MGVTRWVLVPASDGSCVLSADRSSITILCPRRVFCLRTMTSTLEIFENLVATSSEAPFIKRQPVIFKVTGNLDFGIPDRGRPFIGLYYSSIVANFRRFLEHLTTEPFGRRFDGKMRAFNVTLQRGECQRYNHKTNTALKSMMIETKFASLSAAAVED